MAALYRGTDTEAACVQHSASGTGTPQLQHNCHLLQIKEWNLPAVEGFNCTTIVAIMSKIHFMI